MTWSIAHKYERMLRKQRTENDSAASLRKASLGAWATIAARVQSHFQTAKTAAESAGWFEAAYVWRSDEHRTVQLFFGKHPTGGTAAINVKEGASAVVSQGLDGTMIMLLYPYRSAAQKRDKPYLVWRITSDPMTVKDGVISDFIEDFLVYVRVSSALFIESAKDRQRVEQLEERSRENEGKATRFPGRTARIILAAATSAAVVLLVLWTLDKDGPYEPWIGLVGLLTAWLTAAVQKRDGAVGQAKVAERAQAAGATAHLVR